MNLSHTAVRRPITTIMFFASIVMLGLVSYFKLPLQVLPNITSPGGGAYCRIQDSLSPEEMERRIIMPIEGEIAQLQDVKNIYTYSHRNGVFFRLEFEFGTNVKYRMVDLQERLDRFRRTFPRRSMYIYTFPFETSHFNREFMDLVLKGPRSDPYLESIDADKIRQKLEDIDGVATAEIWGGKERSVDINVLQDKLQEFNLPIWQVQNRIQTFASEPVFLGDIEERGKKLFVRLDGQFRDASEIEDVVIKNNGGISVRHIGEVKDSQHSRRYLRRVDGKPALGIGMEKEALVNPVELSRRTHKVIDEINRTIPEGYELDITWETATSIIEMLQTLTKLALMGIALSMGVLYLFVRNMRMSFIVCLVIPICIIATFNGMYFMDMSINMFTLVGLAVGVGSLIDTSIVVLENTFRHHQKGKNGYQAALSATKEVGLPVIAVTMTNLVVFLPVVFVEGFIRLMFIEAALAIIFPIIISALVALTLVPMLTASLLMVVDRRKKKEHEAPINKRYDTPASTTTSARPKSGFFSSASAFLGGVVSYPFMKTIRQYYSTILKSCLRHRVRFLIAIVLFVLYTFYYSADSINRDILDEPEDNQWFYVYVYLPDGTKQEHTIEVVSQVEDILLDNVPEIEHVHSWVRDDSANIRVKLKDLGERDRESETIKEDLRPYFEQITVAEVTYNPTRTRGENQAPPVDSGRGGTIEIRGPEYNQINELAENFAAVMNQIPGIRDVYSDNEPGPLEVHFELDRDAAALLQITPRLVAQSIQLADRRGDYAIIQMKKDDDEIDIYFNQIEKEEDLLKPADEIGGMKFEELKQIPVYSPSMGSTVSLEELGNMQIKRGMSSLRRENRERIGYIRFETAPNTNYSDIEMAVQGLLDVYPVPAGYRMTLSGRSRRIDEVFEQFKMMLWLSLILVYMVMAALFESYSKPFVIFLSIPLAIVGIVWLFILTNSQFNEMAVMGAVFLVGMLPNSAIILIHFASYLRSQKNHIRERAVMLAANYRLRPILMTVLTTQLGLLPMAIEFKGQENDWVPFARVVIGGLASSTVLTLIIVPGFYFIVEDITNFVKQVVRYITSWRWVFVFWSKHKRSDVRTSLTSYRQKPLREEPLVVDIDHLTRIYPIPKLERLANAVQTQLQRGLFPALSPAPGIVASPFSDPGITVTRDRPKALDAVSLRIEQGLFGLLGPNGAGKTTLLRLIAGIDQPTRGYLSICGYDIKTEAKKAQKLVGYLPQYFDVYGHMTAYQYLEYFALLKGIKRKKARRATIESALEQVNLLDSKNVPVGNFSGGMKRRIGLAQIFIHPPKVLIVDEPTVGLDPIERLRFRNLLVQLSQNRVVILSTHIVEDIAHSCQRLALVDQGKISFTGAQEDLIESVRGKVWELTVQEDRAWHTYRREFIVAGQSYTSSGVNLRIVSDRQPANEAELVDPTLEDAYLYHTATTTKMGNLSIH